MKIFLILVFSLSVVFGDETGIQEFVEGNKLFTGAVYNEILLDNNDNILASPFSVETILALTQSGANGATGQEIRSSLFLPTTKEETESVIKSVLPTIHSDHYTLKTANKVYVENNFAIKEDFKKIATDVYQAGFENVEFAQNVEAAAAINQWVEEQTENKIHDLVSPGDLNGLTRVVLVNALYFLGNWTTPFDIRHTKKTDFYTTEDKTLQTDTMIQESEEFNFYEDPDLDAKFLELPFIGEDASMTIVLPNKKEGIAILERQIKTVLATPKYTKEFVQVALPKFRIKSTIDFKEILENLGVHSAFNPLTADFSGIAGIPGEILINKVAQNTFIDVSEAGVEAAAATVVVGPTAVLPPAKQTFIADHPFVFYIKVKDIVLFEGRVLVPKY